MKINLKHAFEASDEVTVQVWTESEPGGVGLYARVPGESMQRLARLEVIGGVLQMTLSTVYAPKLCAAMGIACGGVVPLGGVDVDGESEDAP